MGAGSREGVPAWARAVPLLAGFAVIEQARAGAPGRADHHRPAPGPLSTAYFPAREPAGSINCTKVRPASTSSASTPATAATAAVSKARRPEPASLAICDPAGRVVPAVQKHHLYPAAQHPYQPASSIPLRAAGTFIHPSGMKQAEEEFRRWRGARSLPIALAARMLAPVRWCQPLPRVGSAITAGGWAAVSPGPCPDVSPLIALTGALSRRDDPVPRCAGLRR
jgi:hypothetical protein